MLQLISEPGTVCSTQAHMQRYGNYYKDSPKRKSIFDDGVTVLDVRTPIIVPNHTPSSSYRILEGHTRFLEAARQGIGIEAHFAQNIADLDSLPEECFTTLSKYHCRGIFPGLDEFQQDANDAGIIFISDLVTKYYS